MVLGECIGFCLNRFTRYENEALLTSDKSGIKMASKSELTPKQQNFCRCIVSGNTLSDSYREAYSTSRMSTAAVYVEASRLMANPKISLRVEQLNKAKDRALIGAAVSDREKSLAKIRELMEQADTDAVQLQAAVWLGKSAALFTDVIQTNDKTRTPAEIQAEIERRLAAFVNQPDGEVH